MKFKNSFSAVLALFFLFNFSSKIYGQSHSQILNNLFQNTREIYFEFDYSSKAELNKLSKIISLAHKVTPDKAFAFANKNEFAKFLDLGYNYNILRHPGLIKNPKMLSLSDIKEIEEWDFYPTYEAYIDIMYQFETDFPDICDVFSIGTTVEGRKLMMIRISDNAGTDEGEPQFLYTSTMHGNEAAGYVLSLHLIDYLLNNYGSNAQVTNLVDNIDIWINPLANPDGAYAGGNSTISGGTRSNANGIDLNRNFPDPEDGPHPDGLIYQPETEAFMQIAEEQNFVISSNWHAGAEVVNYPWDTWATLHADDNWWQLIGREWADTSQANSPNGYFTNLDNGITNGYAWYEVNGGRQDYMTFFRHCREFTLEISGEFYYPAEQLPDLWEYNYRSFLNYMTQVLYGIHGTVTNAVTGNPIEAKIFINNHDIDNSWVLSSYGTGKYFRPVYEGTYSLTYSADCYEPVTIENVSVENYQTTIVDVQLQPTDFAVDFSVTAQEIQVGASIDFLDNSCGSPTSWNWTFEGGTPATSTEQNPNSIIYATPGTFDVSLVVSDGINTQTITKENYIIVDYNFLIANGSITTCEGLFYDSGGNDSGYSTGEDYSFTIFPSSSNQKLKVEFLEFSVEYEDNCIYDWLKIFDGDNNSAQLIGQFCGDNSPGTIISTHETGALTFHFFSDSYINDSGWKAEISCVGTAPSADFNANMTSIYEGDTVSFFDNSNNNPTAWEWIFYGGNPEYSTEQNPTVIYNTQGDYDVVLKVSNEFGIDSIIFQNYIEVQKLTDISVMRERQLKIFPNPVNEKLYIECDTDIKKIELFELTGRKVFNKKYSSKNIGIAMDYFENEIFIIKIQTENEIFVRKICR